MNMVERKNHGLADALSARSRSAPAPSRRPVAFESFGEYMAVKEQKLRAQQQDDAMASVGVLQVARGPLWGVCVWIDGRTDPPRDVLRTLVTQAGGRFETYLHRELVTHVVGTHFARGRALELRRAVQTRRGGATRPLYVVKPAWILDSIRAGRPLPEWQYGVDEVSRDSKQTVLPVSRPGSVPSEEDADAMLHLDVPPSVPCGPETPIESSTSLTEEESAVSESSEHWQSDKMEWTDFGVSTSAPTMAYALRGLRSSRENPHFVRDFFAQSRLHFIGSFRETYETILRRLQSDRQPSSLDRMPQTLPRRDRFVLHVDMDAFFVSVSLAKRPHLRGKPVAVCHSGTGEHSRAEISSASYEARARGVRANMFFGEARRLCPELVMVPYDFAAYKAACEVLYRIFFAEADLVEGVSIDEAYLLLQHCSEVERAEEIASRIRQRILQEIEGCTASIGIGRNKLFARLATKYGKEKLGKGSQFVLVDRAHPDGFGSPMGAALRSFLDEVPIRAIPGVGWSTEARLRDAMKATSGSSQDNEVLLVASVREHFNLERLEKLLGSVNGNRLYRFLNGIDSRPVQPIGPRKSVSAQIGWGVRFLSTEEDKVRSFMIGLSLVVADRLCEARIARCNAVTVTALRRQAGAGMPYKPLGHGLCDEYSATTSVQWYQCAQDPSLQQKVDQEFAETVWNLYRTLQIPHAELRGAGVHARKLAEHRLGPGISSRSENSTTTPIPQQLHLHALWKTNSRVSRSEPDVSAKTQRCAPPPPPPRSVSPLTWTRATLRAQDGARSVSLTLVEGQPVSAVRHAFVEPTNASSLRTAAAHRSTPLSAMMRSSTSASFDCCGIDCHESSLFSMETRPPAPPDVDIEVWNALPTEVARQVWKENLAQNQVRRWKRHRPRRTNGVLRTAENIFQPTLSLFAEMRAGQVSHNGAVICTHNQECFWRTTKPVRVVERGSRKPNEDETSGQYHAPAEPLLPLADWSMLIEQYFQRLASGRVAIGHDLDRSWSEFSAKVSSFLQELVFARQWSYLCAFLELLRVKLRSFGSRIWPGHASAASAYSSWVNSVQRAWVQLWDDQGIPIPTGSSSLAIRPFQYHQTI